LSFLSGWAYSPKLLNKNFSTFSSAL